MHDNNKKCVKLVFILENIFSFHYMDVPKSLLLRSWIGLGSMVFSMLRIDYKSDIPLLKHYYFRELDKQDNTLRFFNADSA